MKDLKNLKTIRLDRAPVSDSSFQTIGTNCKSLVEIGLSKCVGVTNMGIMQLVYGCVGLKIVNLTCCRFITDAAISALANSCRNLVSLKLEACDKVTEKSLDQLGSYCLRLEELDLTDCCGVNDEGKLLDVISASVITLTMINLPLFFAKVLILFKVQCSSYLQDSNICQDVQNF